MRNVDVELYESKPDAQSATKKLGVWNSNFTGSTTKISGVGSRNFWSQLTSACRGLHVVLTGQLLSRVFGTMCRLSSVCLRRL